MAVWSRGDKGYMSLVEKSPALSAYECSGGKGAASVAYATF